MKIHTGFLLGAVVVLLGSVAVVETLKSHNPSALASVLGGASLIEPPEIRPWVTFNIKPLGDNIFWFSRPAGEPKYGHGDAETPKINF